MKIGIIGAGKIGGALLRAALARTKLRPEEHE